jgi:hypothetical protein
MISQIGEDKKQLKGWCTRLNLNCARITSDCLLMIDDWVRKSEFTAVRARSSAKLIVDGVLQTFPKLLELPRSQFGIHTRICIPTLKSWSLTGIAKKRILNNFVHLETRICEF